MQIRNGQFYQGDCLEILPTLAAGSVDMVLCDLPYGTTRNAWDSVVPLEPLWHEIWRLAADRAPVVLTAQTPFDKVLGASCLDRLKYEWIWRKTEATGHLNAKKAPLKCHENILVFCRNGGVYNPQMTPGKPYAVKGGSTGKGKGNNNYGAYGSTRHSNGEMRYPLSIVEFAKDHKNNKINPTQKPVALFEYLICTYSEPGAVVLDMTAGSGTTAIAAERAGRRWICIERDETYYWSAVARLLGGDE